MQLGEREDRRRDDDEQHDWQQDDPPQWPARLRCGHAAIVTLKVALDTVFLVSVASKYTDIMTSVFSSTIASKAWFATAAIALAAVQVLTGARIFGKLDRVVRIQRPYVNRVHRWSGRLAVLFTLPVAFHCIFILGFQTTDRKSTRLNSSHVKN